MTMKAWQEAQRAQEVQSVIFSREDGGWTLAKAKEWLADHDFPSDKVDETTQSWRFRQFEPSECVEGSFQTLTENMPTGISMVACDRQKCAPGDRRGDLELDSAGVFLNRSGEVVERVQRTDTLKAGDVYYKLLVATK